MPPVCSCQHRLQIHTPASGFDRSRISRIRISLIYFEGDTALYIPQFDGQHGLIQHERRSGTKCELPFVQEHARLCGLYGSNGALFGS